MPQQRPESYRGAWLLLVALPLGLVLPAAGRAADYDSWSKVESAQETRDYGQQIRDGKFEPAQKAFIDDTLIPQLALEANRASIANVRQRIRDVAVRGATKKEVVDQGNAALRDGVLGLVADKNAEPLVRVNAMLLIGELQDFERAPWVGSLAPLVKAAGDGALPLEVRVAAVSGLERHLAAAAVGDPAAATAAPVLATLVTSPPTGDAAAVRWLTARTLDLLPKVPAPPQAVTAAAKILADETADPDLRVRAAAAVGRLAKADSKIDAAAAMRQIESLAIAVITADLEAAKERRFARSMTSGQQTGGVSGERGGLSPAPPAPPAATSNLGGPGIFGGQFGGELEGATTPAVIDEDAVPALACRRDAWRLFTLAEAIKPARGGSGLAGLLAGDAATAAADLEAILRQSALELDKEPTEEKLVDALASIKKQDAAGDQPGKSGQPAGAAEPGSPFGQPAGGSPF